MGKFKVAIEILRQLGGNKFIAMVGAKNFVADQTSCMFKIGRNAKGITHVKIELTPMDLYDMKFYKFGRKIMDNSHIPVAEKNGVYDDMLCSIFESETGLYTKL